jgi:hypothetical protein
MSKVTLILESQCHVMATDINFRFVVIMQFIMFVYLGMQR